MSKVLLLSLHGLVLVGLSTVFQAQNASAQCSTSSGISSSRCSVKVEALGCSSTLIAQCKRRVPQNEYSHSQSLLTAEASDSLRQAITAIPFAGELTANAAQKAALHNWLYDFLVAFSAAGNDSLAAAFYTRGIEKSARLESDKHFFLLENLQDQWDKEIGRSFSKALEEVEDDLFAFLKVKKIAQEKAPLLFDIFREGHKYLLHQDERDYYIEKVSFHDSAFRIFEMQKRYEVYLSSIESQEGLPTGHWTADLSNQQAIIKHLAEGENLVFAEVGFVVQEPVVFSTAPIPGWTPFFFRMVWDDEQQQWQLVELVLGVDIPHGFLFSFI